jgi:CubicO group peptidase (beta-lactamase class C family)
MMVQGICEEKFSEIKNIFSSFFEKNQETGAGFSVIQNQKKIISIYGGVKNSRNEAWDQNTIVNTFSASKGIYEACIAKLLNENLIDIEKPVSYYWPNFNKKNKSHILVKHILSHQSGVYRFKSQLKNQDLIDWEKIIFILENQEPDHHPGSFTYYHAKTHGYLIGNLIKIITNLSVGQYLQKEIAHKNNIKFYFGLNDEDLTNAADLSLKTFGPEDKNKNVDNYDAFNNPSHDIKYYNTLEWRKSEVPSMGGHGNSDSIALIYDYLANDLKNNSQNIIKQNLLQKYLLETNFEKDLSLNFPIRWTNLGFILRGGWMFGKFKESFGHNGWGGSLGFADPVNGMGISYVTRELNPTMGVDQRVITLIKKLYELLL